MDATSSAAEADAANAGNVYLIRPDMHVAARRDQASADGVKAAPQRKALMLSRLAQLLAHPLGNPARAVALVGEATRDANG